MEGSKRSRKHPRVRETPAKEYATQAEAGGLTGVLLDSDVVIEILRGNRRLEDAAADLASSGVRTYCTAVTWAEVYAGLRSGEAQLAEDFFSSRGEVVLDARAGRRAGAYLAAFARSDGVEIADALIAAAASTSGLRLWTLNRRHYPMRDLRFWEPPKRSA